MNKMLKQAVDYINNSGMENIVSQTKFTMIAAFDDDNAPIGPFLRRDLINANLAVEDDNMFIRLL